MENLLKEQTKEELDNLLEVLDEREVQIIRMRFGLDGQKAMTLQEIADILKNPSTDKPLTRERIRQIENEAIRKLRSITTTTTTLLNRAEIKRLSEELKKKSSKRSTRKLPPKKDEIQ